MAKAIVSTEENCGASRRNPIIGDTAGDTLYQAACAVAFLARVHADRADYDAGGLSTDEERGMALVCETIAVALCFEVEGRQ